MDKKALAKKIIATVQDDDLDMHNKFLPRPLLEEMADAATGAYEIMPRRTLRERQYQQQPLMIRPDYGQNFLDKLKAPFEGKSVMDDVMAADEENLDDFSMPSEMLKHQEKVHPRVLTDDYYEVNRPGPGAGGDDLEGYWDRGWEDTDSPEMSEDKWNRMWTIPGEYNKMARNVVATSLVGDTMAGRVIAGYLLNMAPKASGGIRLAKLMDDLTASKIHGVKDLKTDDVKIVRQKNSPGVGKFIFYTTSPGNPSPGFTKPYTTTFEFIPEGNITDTNKLNVRVSCTCPSWLYWGAQYHAYMEKYLYGPIQPVFAVPGVRDKEGSFLACKHVLKCINFIKEARMGEGFKIKEMAPKLKERINRDPRLKYKEIQIRKTPIEIPEHLVYVENKPEMQKVMKDWEAAPNTGNARRNILKKLTDKDDVTFMAFKYPSTATVYVAERLRELAIKAMLAHDTVEKKEIVELINEVDEANHISHIVKEVAIPPELIRFEKDPAMKRSIRDMDKKDDLQKDLFIKSQTDPDAMAYLAYKFYLDLNIPGYVTDALKKIVESPKASDEDKEKAETWIKGILGGIK